MNEQFLLQIATYLDTKGIKVDYEKIKQIINKDPMMAKLGIDTTASKQQIRDLATEIHKVLDGIFKNAGVDDFKISIKEIESIINSTLKQAQKQAIELEKAHGEAIIENAKRKQKAIDDEIKKQRELFLAKQDAYKHEEKLTASLENIKNRAEGASKGFDAYVKSLKPQALKEYSDEIRKISDGFSKASETGKSIDLSKANSHLSKFKGEMKAAGMEATSFTKIIKENIAAFTNWYIIGNIVSGVVRDFKDAIGTIKEVDTYLTEISKTSKISAENLKKLGIDAFDYASKYGTTVQAYLAGVQEMSRAGYDEFTAKGLAELSILAQSAGDMTAELANEYLIATNAAYKLNGDVLKLNAVLDSQNQVTNRNAITMSKLAEATKIAGSQAASSGVDVDELTAAISTMGVVTQAEGSQLGRAFKGILMNLQQVKGELDNGEIIDAESFTKVEKAADALGVSLKEVRDGVVSLRNPMEVLKELAEVYSNLTEGDVRGANLISSLGGKYRGNQLDALLRNFDMYEKILSDYQNATGSAAEEAQKTADSIEGRLNKLTNTWNRTVANVVDSDILKTFISIGTGAMDLVDQLNLLQTAMVGLTVFGVFKGGSTFLSWINNAISSTMAFGNALNTVKAKNFVADTNNLSKAIQGLSLSQATAVLSTQNLSKQTIIATLSQAGFSKEEAKTTAATLTMSAAQTTATGTTWSLNAALKGLYATAMANPIGAIITGLTVLISSVSLVTNKVRQAKKEALETSKQLTQQYRQEQQSLDEQVESYKKLQKQLELGNLSTEETKSIKEQLYEIQTSLIDTYGDEASGLDLVNGKYKEQIDLLSELSKVKAQDYLAKNRNAFQTAKEELEKTRHYDLGNLKYGDQNLVEFLNTYKETEPSLKVLKDTYAYREGQHIIRVSANVEEADRVLHQLYNDVQDYGRQTGEDVGGILDNISSQLNKTWTDDLKSYKEIYDEYMKNLVVEDDTLRPLYKQAIDSVSEYNKALASGEGIEEAKKNLDEIKTKVIENMGLIEGSFDVFKDIFGEDFLKIPTGGMQQLDNLPDYFNNVSDSVYEFKESFAEVFKANEQEINNFQSSLKTIGDSLSKLDKLSSTEIVDLMQQFEELSEYGYTGSEGIDVLESALRKLAQRLFDNLPEVLKSNDAFIQMHDEAMNAGKGVETLSSALSKMNDSGKFLDDVKAEFEELGYISSDTLAKIISKYPELESVIAKFNVGLADGNDILAELKVAYNKDLENYRTAVIEKIGQNEEFFNSIVKDLPDWVKNLADAYGIDYTNWKNLNDAKLDIYKDFKKKQSALDILQEKGASGGYISMYDAMEMQKLRKEIADAERMYDQIVSGISTKLNLDKMEGYKPKPTSGNKGKSSDPAWLVEYKQKRADLDHRLAMDKVTEKQYYDGVEKLNDDYLKAHKKTHLDMYRKNVEEIYKGRNKLDQDKISKSLNKLKYRLGMDEITEEQYYDQLEKLNEKYLKKYKGKYLDQYEKIVEEIYKGKKKLEEEKFEKFLANMDVSLSEVDRYLKFVDKGSIEELTLLQTGFNEATKNADELNRRIKELNKQYSKGKISQETYTDRLDKLNSKLFSSADAMRSYRDSIVNYMKSVYDEQLKTLETDQKDALESLEENHKDILDSLDKQLDRYKEIVNQQKESLRQK